MKNYSFINNAIVRMPLGVKQPDLTWQTIHKIFSKEENREALFLGSPDIYKMLELWEKGETILTEEDLKKLQRTLYKYASRLSNRCTPFGLFATVSTIEVSSGAPIVVKDDSISRHTKFDMFFLSSLLPVLTKMDSIRALLRYFPNNSIYKVFDKYRYVEYYFKDNVRFHKISEVVITDYLEFVHLKASEGITISDLVKALISDEISEEDALEFINTVIDNQFLVSELELTITGEDFFDKLIKAFSEERFCFHEAQVIKNFLINLKSKLKDLDVANYNIPSNYLEMHEALEDEIGKVDIAKLFQVDSYRKTEHGALGFKTLQHLRPAITILNKLQSKSENSNLKEFKRKFRERYEEYEQPLVKVLDPDFGIGYGSNSSAKTPLVDELAIKVDSSDKKQITLDSKKAFLFKKLLQANKENVFDVELTDQEMNQFEENDHLYPDTFSVFFNIFNERGTEKIHLKAVSGASATSLIGRFSHLDESILKLCNEISDIESKLHPDKIIAEIVHLPQARTGNILYRSFQRDYEIPYLGNSSLDMAHQIHIDDLYVSIKKGRIVLRSKKHNKEVIPRLSNAHNFSANALPIYHFLCDIQSQDTNGFGFSWGPLQYEFDFLPRVSYKGVVLSKATWNISHQDITGIMAAGNTRIVESVRTFQKKRNIPNIVNLTQGDNEVLINFTNDLSSEVFYSMIKGKSFVQLTEFLFEESTVTGDYCNEFIVAAHRKIQPEKEARQSTLALPANIKNVTSSFSIGEEWLYYKLYCGERAAERLLSEAVKNVVTDLNLKAVIDKWFFIRYKEAGGHHLRFRIRLKDIQNLGLCIETVKKHLKPFEEAGILWKIQADTYVRELQRYGSETIEATETLFHNDSECTFQFIGMIEGDGGEEIRWKFALLSLHTLLEDFKLSLKQKEELLKTAKTSFGKEFNRSGDLNKQINQLYANHEKEIENFLDEVKTEELYAPLWEIIKERSNSNREAVNQIKEVTAPDALPSILISHLHMTCNRIFIAKQRQHEMVVYDFLYKYYAKQLNMKKGKLVKPELLNT